MLCQGALMRQQATYDRYEYILGPSHALLVTYAHDTYAYIHV